MRITALYLSTLQRCAEGIHAAATGNHSKFFIYYLSTRIMLHAGSVVPIYLAKIVVQINRDASHAISLYVST